MNVVNHKKLPNNINLYNAIEILPENIAIYRDINKCIDCGLCKEICKEREHIKDICHGKKCINCGQCIQSCPVGALLPKNDILKVNNALKSQKICIAYTSPSVRVSLGDYFGKERGTFVQGKLVTALRNLGFKYVFDVTFGADLTVIEEAAELVQRIETGGVLPMFTSCCPSWVSYIEKFHPEILPNLSTCKSPIGMQGAIVKDYFAKIANINPNDLFTVAITPCTAKKYEIARKEITGTDAVLTVEEFSILLKAQKIDFNNLEDGVYDSLLSEGSGAGMIFGNTGGVMEATLRTTYKILTGNNLSNEVIEYNEVRGFTNVREAQIRMGDMLLNVAVVHQLSCVIPLLEDIKSGKSKYHFIEVMNCLGGCIGGGGQPKSGNGNEMNVKKLRIDSLYRKDTKSEIRLCHQNPDIVKLYNEFLNNPLSEKSKEILHTTYTNKENNY